MKLWTKVEDVVRLSLDSEHEFNDSLVHDALIAHCLLQAVAECQDYSDWISRRANMLLNDIISHHHRAALSDSTSTGEEHV